MLNLRLRMLMSMKLPSKSCWVVSSLHLQCKLYSLTLIKNADLANGVVSILWILQEG